MAAPQGVGRASYRGPQMSGYKPMKTRTMDDLIASLAEKRGRFSAAPTQAMANQQEQGYGKPAKAFSTQDGLRSIANAANTEWVGRVGRNGPVAASNPAVDASQSQFNASPVGQGYGAKPGGNYSFGGAPIKTGGAQSGGPYTFSNTGTPVSQQTPVQGQGIGLGQPSGAAPMQYPSAQPAQSPMMTPGGAQGAAGGSVGPFRGNVNAGVAMPFMNPNAQLNPNGGLPRGITGTGIVGHGGLAGPLREPSSGGIGGLVGGIGDVVGGIGRGIGDFAKNRTQSLWDRITNPQFPWSGGE